MANPIGRLLEIRLTSALYLYDAMNVFKQIYRVMPRERGPACVIADLRRVQSIEPEVIDLVSGYMRMDNPYVERNAFLLSATSASVLMHGEALMRQAALPSRRMFNRRDEAEAWMNEVLTPDESAHMHAFLDEESATSLELV